MARSDPTIDATAKGADANSYVTRAEAQAYFDERENVDSWEDADNADKDRALIMATNRLEREEWLGGIRTTTQRLRHPRSGLFTHDGISYNEDTVCRPVKEATYELALAILDGTYQEADSGLEPYRDVKLGPIAVQPNMGRTAGTLPRVVIQLLEGVRVGASDYNVPLVRG